MRAFAVTLILVLVLFAPAVAGGTPLTCDDIRRIMIDESLAAYPGDCPCPYSKTKKGRRCGKRSAWYRKSGRAPLCYTTDITDEMVKEWREIMGE
jgi:hypothetical protein